MPCDTAQALYRQQKAIAPNKRVVLAPKQAFRLAAEQVTSQRRPEYTVTGVYMDSSTTIVVDGIFDPDGRGRDQYGRRPRMIQRFTTDELHELAHLFMDPTKTPPPVKVKTPAEIEAEEEAARVARVVSGKEKPRVDERVEVRHVRKGVREDTVDLEFFVDEPVLIKLTPEQLAFKQDQEVEVEVAAVVEPVRPKGPQEYVLPDGTKAIQMPDGTLYVK